jgi:two-component system, response regulator FlrC
VASDLPVPARALVTDIRMEPIDGVSLARLISGRWPGTPILFVSGFGDVDQYGSLRGPLLPKPFSPAQFLQAVQRLMTNEEAPRGS